MLKQALGLLSKKYICPEIISIPLKNNQHGWYHPQSHHLFIPPYNESTAQYLGFSEKDQAAYFTTHRLGFLLKMSSSSDDSFIDNHNAVYQRLDELLILKYHQAKTADQQNTIDAFYALNIDGISRLLIIGSREQKNHQHFTVNIAALNYAVLQIAHRGTGFLHCHLPQQPAAMGDTITRKGQHLLLFITHQMLIINDVFDPRKNTAHSRLKFIFTHGSITAAELASYYNTCNNNIHNNNANDEGAVIPMPNLLPLT